MPEALIHLNDETGEDRFAVELANDIGNWLDSFLTLDEAIGYIADHGLTFDRQRSFRDTRYESVLARTTMPPVRTDWFKAPREVVVNVPASAILTREIAGPPTAIVHLNDEAGIAQYSVALSCDPEFWLDSFPRLTAAEKFVRGRGLPYRRSRDFVDTRSSSASR